MGSAMGLRLIAKNFLTYGGRALWGKVTAAFLCLATPVCAEEVTILMLGDSLTQGFGLPADQGLVPQLQGWLRDQGAEVALINAGVSGDTTAGGAARVAWSLTPEVDAMVLALGANDMLRGLDPAVSRENLSRILEVAAAKEVDVLLVGVEAPANLGPDYKAEFDAMFPALAEAFDVPYAGSIFGGFEGLAPAEWATYLQPDGLHPNAEGVARMVTHLGPSVLRLAQDN